VYKARRFATRHARGYERFYNFVEPAILAVIGLLSKVSNGRLNSAITSAEKHTKGLLFDCQMCGNCVLSSTGMTCPMNCPKTIRNGPCGGVRENGNCEVDPDMKCVWVDAWDGASRMQGGAKIHEVQFATNKAHLGTSAWLRLLEENQQAEHERLKINSSGVEDEPQ
jgi:hypothetical protein